MNWHPSAKFLSLKSPEVESVTDLWSNYMTSDHSRNCWNGHHHLSIAKFSDLSEPKGRNGNSKVWSDLRCLKRAAISSLLMFASTYSICEAFFFLICAIFFSWFAYFIWFPYFLDFHGLVGSSQPHISGWKTVGSLPGDGLGVSNFNAVRSLTKLRMIFPDFVGHL